MIFFNSSYNWIIELILFRPARKLMIVSFLVILFILRKEIILFFDLLSSEVYADAGDREVSRRNFCKTNCPVREPVPANYPRCRPLGSHEVFYASQTHACWTICKPEMVITYSKVAWWEFWIKAPSADEINEFAKRSLINASKCLENGYTGQIESRKGTLAAYLNDFMHDWGVAFSGSLFFFALFITIIAFLIK